MNDHYYSWTLCTAKNLTCTDLFICRHVVNATRLGVSNPKLWILQIVAHYISLGLLLDCCSSSGGHDSLHVTPQKIEIRLVPVMW